MRSFRHRTALLGTAGLMAFLSACGGGSQYVPVDIQDKGAAIVSTRADWLPFLGLGISF